jgi:hypothetical protein
MFLHFETFSKLFLEILLGKTFSKKKSRTPRFSSSLEISEEASLSLSLSHSRTHIITKLVVLNGLAIKSLTKRVDEPILSRFSPEPVSDNP